MKIVNELSGQAFTVGAAVGSLLQQGMAAQQAVDDILAACAAEQTCQRRTKGATMTEQAEKPPTTSSFVRGESR